MERAWPKVVVILLNWNGLADTLECVAPLRRLNDPNYQVVIVDNGSGGNDVQILMREAPECHVIENGRNEGFSEGNNIGVRYGLAEGADYFLILNNDTLVAPELLDILVGTSVQDREIAIVAPRIDYYDEPMRTGYPRVVDAWPLLLNFHVGTLGIFNRIILKSPSKVVPVRFADGSCFLITREAIEKVGLFDPIYFFGGYESLCLCRRVLAQGYRIVAALDALLWAKISASLGSRRHAGLTYAYWAPRNRVIFARKHLGWPHLILFGLGLPIHMLAWAVLWGRQASILEKVLAISRGLRDGLRVGLGGSIDKIREQTLG